MNLNGSPQVNRELNKDLILRLNSDIIFELSKYTNIENLLLSSKSLYSKNNEHIISNCRYRELKDFVHIENILTLKYLIHKVVNKRRFDLFDRFLRATPYRILGIIVFCGILVRLKDKIDYNNSIYASKKIDKTIQYFGTNKDVETVFQIVKMNFQEFKLFYIITKYKINYHTYRKIIEDNYSNILLKCEEFYLAYRDLNPINTLCELRKLSSFKDESKILFGDEIFELIPFDTHITQLVMLQENFDKNALLTDRRYQDFIERLASSIEYVGERVEAKQVFEILFKNHNIKLVDVQYLLDNFGNIKRINLLLVELYKTECFETPRNISKGLFGLLCRKYDLTSNENVSIYKQFIDLGVIHGFYEGAKYNNQPLIDYYNSELCSSKVKKVFHTHSPLIDIFKNTSLTMPKSSQDKFQDSYIISRLKQIEKVINKTNYMNYSQEIARLFEKYINIKIDMLLYDRVQNIILFGMLIKHYLNEEIVTIDTEDRMVDFIIEDEYKISKEEESAIRHFCLYAVQQGLEYSAVLEFIMNNICKCKEERSLPWVPTKKSVIQNNIRLYLIETYAFKYFDYFKIVPYNGNIFLLDKALKIAEDGINQYINTFQKDTYHEAYTLINYIVSNSMFDFLSDMNINHFNWHTVHAYSLSLCSDKERLFAIVGPENATIMNKTIERYNNMIQQAKRLGCHINL